MICSGRQAGGYFRSAVVAAVFYPNNMIAFRYYGNVVYCLVRHSKTKLSIMVEIAFWFFFAAAGIDQQAPVV